MTGGLALIGAVLLDLALGDPENIPHPVRLIGSAAARAETLLRKSINNERIAGILATVIIVGGTGAIAWATVEALSRISIYLGFAAQVIIIYQSIALKDLSGHAMAVHAALAGNDIGEARRRVGMIVGRDTEDLGGEGISRACVESVAESVVDGVTAPIFFAAIGGPAAAMAYRAANTLDSMFGHKDQRYINFGWAAARLDDTLNYIPARLTAPVVLLAALILKMDASGALKIWLRDGRKHASPNSGLTEAAFAGALEVTLGGPRSYDGTIHGSPLIGDGGMELSGATIKKAVMLAYMAAFIFTVVALAGLAAFKWFVY
ncbi:MAG: cobalamin biosynthesis protein CobD [Nitrospinae bacterium]|nr:cobalamin biosynthesis protein CobD [Nitrospinota bacterium]